MTDRELLEAAAKAAGFDLEWEEVSEGDMDCDPGWYCVIAGTRRCWSPLTDDGDALRLAVLLGIGVQYDAFEGAEAWQLHRRYKAKRCVNANDPYAATRRAIVRAAASLAGGDE